MITANRAHGSKAPASRPANRGIIDAAQALVTPMWSAGQPMTPHQASPGICRPTSAVKDQWQIDAWGNQTLKAMEVPV